MMTKDKKTFKKEETSTMGFPMPKKNYYLLAIGFVIIVIGFLLMIGGTNDNPEVFNYDMFSFRRITLAPVVVVLGFIFAGFAIMRKPKNTDDAK